MPTKKQFITILIAGLIYGVIATILNLPQWMGLATGGLFAIGLVLTSKH